ncbi:MAG: DUF4298 domain-containing protein [Oscillospiraceae bacterium]|nr:DUF4298 domain-containing protein [Oscillospiraceae bacterium]
MTERNDSGAAQLRRIEGYEALFDELLALLADDKASAAELEALADKVGELERYFSGAAWKEDFAADEAGLLPPELKRGVLSEDGLYNALEEYAERRSTLERQSTKRKKKRRLGVLLALLLLMTAGTIVFLFSGYRADERVIAALSSDAVRVEQTDFGWFFDGAGETDALIFYPGARVEETAYAPLLHALAADGLDVFLVRMPLRLAVLDQNAADGIRERCDYENWYIGGHSLGGAVAANYASSHELDGVILLASYPTHAVDEPMLILCGSEDGVINRTRLDAAGNYGAVERVELAGGNHARFGDYGAQKGDGEAKLSPAAQQEQSVEAIASWIAREEKTG